MIVSASTALMEIVLIVLMIYQRRMEELIHALKNEQYPLCRRESRPKLTEIARNALHIRVIGRTLQQVLMNNSKFFLERLRAGATVELLLTHYNLARYVMAEIGTDHLSDLSSALTTIISIKEEMSKNNYSGQLEVRFITYVPSLSFVAIDVDRAEGILVVEMVPPYMAPVQRPNILLRADTTHLAEQSLFEDFKNVVESMWEKAEKITDVNQFLEKLERFRQNFRRRSQRERSTL